jgi:hypothetical protein
LEAPVGIRLPPHRWLATHAPSGTLRTQCVLRSCYLAAFDDSIPTDALIK